MNVHDLKQLARKLRFTFDKSAGQCFLVNPNVCTQMVAMLEIDPNSDKILEIGPGFGAFSYLIAESVREFYMIELSPVVSKYLETTFRLSYPTSRITSRNIQYLQKIPQKTRITIIEGDVLLLPWPKVNKIISNLPFSITFPFLVQLIRQLFLYRLL